MDSVTQPEPYTCKHGCERDLIMQAFADEANARIATALAEREGDRAEIARLRAFVEDVAKQWLPSEPEPFDDFDPSFEDAYAIIVAKARATLSGSQQ